MDGNLYNKIYKYLLSFGFSPVHKGFRLIIYAVMIIIEGGFKYKSLSEVYDGISKNYKISRCGIQKNIKNAVDYANLNCKIDFFVKEFGNITNVSGQISCGAFLCFTANKILYG